MSLTRPGARLGCAAVFATALWAGVACGASDGAGRRAAATVGFATGGPVEQKIDTRLPSCEFVNMGLASVLEYITAASQAQVSVNWAALERAGVKKGTPITLAVKNVSARKCLELALEQARPQGGRLGFVVDTAGISVSTRDDLDRKIVAKTYDLSTLLVTPPRPDPGEPPRQVVTKQAGAGGVTVTVRTEGGRPPSGRPDVAPLPDQVRHIEGVIRDLTDPDAWQAGGGRLASARAAKDSLIVTAPLRIHSQVAHLLALLPTAGNTDAELPAAKASRISLAKVLPELTFSGTEFYQVLEFVRAAGGVNLVPHWPVLEAAGIGRTAPITLKARGVTFGQALKLALAEAGKGKAALDYFIDDEGVVRVSTADAFAWDLPIHCYPIADLLSPPKGEAASALADPAEQLVNLIMDTVDPKGWVRRGGRHGAVCQVGGMLLVRAPPDSEKQVADLLTKCRAGGGIPKPQP